MGRELSLDCLTLTDTSPVDLVDAAQQAGFHLVSLWVQPPSLYPRQLLTRETAPAVRERLAYTGVRAGGLEVFDLVSAEQIASCRPALELGASVGAQAAVVIHNRNPDRAEVVDLLGAFVELARDCGLATRIEPISVGRTRTLAEGAALIRDAGVDAQLTFDFLHLMRTGGSPADLSAIPPHLIANVQVCDGPLEFSPEVGAKESIAERLYPGEGEFPIRELLQAAPETAVIGVETPSLRRVGLGMTPAEQARAAMEALRPFLPSE